MSERSRRIRPKKFSASDQHQRRDSPGPTATTHQPLPFYTPIQSPDLRSSLSHPQHIATSILDRTRIADRSMAKLSIPLLLFLLVAASSAATVLAHRRNLPIPIKMVRGGDVAGAGAVEGDKMECVYTVYIRTGSIWKAGTNSNITLELAGADGNGVGITDLPSWGGLMGEGHSYFERGNLDIFSGRGPCMAAASGPPCWMRVASDGTGPHHGWYCNYVEVTVTGPHKGCAQQLFTVEQWLATDAPPYKLEAVRDMCSRSTAA
uniref:PLAT domain-containing protein n=1 Tax=Leersia perrieri TaxID=77586 RepID=A0A0D9VL55_9ORYZ